MDVILTAVMFLTIARCPLIGGLLGGQWKLSMPYLQQSNPIDSTM